MSNFYKALDGILAIVGTVAGIFFTGYHAGETSVKKDELAAQNKILLDYASASKKIADSYQPIYQKIRNAGKDAGCSHIVNDTIDGLPVPKIKH